MSDDELKTLRRLCQANDTQIDRDICKEVERLLKRRQKTLEKAA